MHLPPPLAIPPHRAGPPDPAGRSDLRDAAARLETAFLAEMLGAAGLGAPRGATGGGVGEVQFASFLRQAQAAALVGGGGIGLAESLFRALDGGDHAGG